MLKQIFNDVSFKIIIRSIDPLLIKSGKLISSGPDSNPVTTWRVGREEEEPFIPGSSLKGVFRSHLEKILKTIDPENKTLVCIPYEVYEEEKKRSHQSRACDISCGKKFEYRQNKVSEWQVGKKNGEKNPPPPSCLVYKESCPICRLFGSLYFKGRIAISDGYLTPEGLSKCVLENRDGVAIDRFSGGAAKSAKFEIQVVSNGEFESTIHLRNFEIWQLGLLGILIQDLSDEMISLGSGTSRGLGRIEGEVKDFTIRVFRTLDCGEQVWGIGKAMQETDADSCEDYGLSGEDFLAFSLSGGETRGAFKQYTLTEESRKDFFSKSIDHCMKKIKNWNTPDAMRFNGQKWEEY